MPTLMTWLRGRLQSNEITLFGRLNGLVRPGPRLPWRIPRPIARLMRWVDGLLADTLRCPRRDEANFAFPGPDYWRVHYNGDRVCSYCGSMDPDQFIALCHRIVEAGHGDVESIERSDKRYKFYVTRPGVRNASEGAIKFYTMHFEDRHRAEANRLDPVIHQARVLSSQSFERRLMQARG